MSAGPKLLYLQIAERREWAVEAEASVTDGRGVTPATASPHCRDLDKLLNLSGVLVFSPAKWER